jgi:hypothetical protein
LKLNMRTCLQTHARMRQGEIMQQNRAHFQALFPTTNEEITKAVVNRDMAGPTGPALPSSPYLSACQLLACTTVCRRCNSEKQATDGPGTDQKGLSSPRRGEKGWYQVASKKVMSVFVGCSVSLAGWVIGPAAAGRVWQHGCLHAAPRARQGDVLLWLHLASSCAPPPPPSQGS